MRTLVRGVLVVVVVVLVAGGGAYVWAGGRTDRALARTFDVQGHTFPIPFPLTEEERADLGVLTDAEADALAASRAVERGRRLVESRYACAACHGADFGGGVMMDAPVIARLFGPNLTLGQGSVTRDYAAADWDRIVRHGVRPDRGGSPMPAEDFQLMSDRELSDIVAYVRSLPPVDRASLPPSVGPIGKVLIATGKLSFSVDRIPSQDVTHAVLPPDEAVTPEFGRHLAGVCTGCHGEHLSGGPITGGDPSWAPARNLTFHAEGLADWSLEDFVRALREGVRPDGRPLLPPMNEIVPMTARMSDVELEAIWTYLGTLPTLPTGS